VTNQDRYLFLKFKYYAVEILNRIDLQFFQVIYRRGVSESKSRQERRYLEYFNKSSNKNISEFKFRRSVRFQKTFYGFNYLDYLSSSTAMALSDNEKQTLGNFSVNYMLGFPYQYKDVGGITFTVEALEQQREKMVLESVYGNSIVGAIAIIGSNLGLTNIVLQNIYKNKNLTNFEKCKSDSLVQLLTGIGLVTVDNIQNSEPLHLKYPKFKFAFSFGCFTQFDRHEQYRLATEIFVNTSNGLIELDIDETAHTGNIRWAKLSHSELLMVVPGSKILLISGYGGKPSYFLTWGI
jgi:hypothetical protein